MIFHSIVRKNYKKSLLEKFKFFVVKTAGPFKIISKKIIKKLTKRKTIQ
jgi:hypothetical protein